MKKIVFCLLAFSAMSTQTYFSQEENSIEETGNVGIGTTDPTAKLDVRGDVNIDSSLVVNDSLTVAATTKIGEDLIVTGNGYFKSDLYADGATFLNGSIYAPYLTELPELDGSELLLLGSDGSILKSGIQLLQNHFYSKQCSTLNGVVQNPMWNNGPNKLFVECPEVFVGIGTNTPLYHFDVRGVGYFSNGIRVGNIATSNYGNSALIEGERVAAQTSPLVRLSVRKTDGTNEVRFKVEANGNVYCTSVRVRLSPSIPIPDYVFQPSYKLMPLSEVRTYVTTNSHLPNVPNEKEIRENGLSVEEMQLKLLEKVEELTLYLLQLDEANQQQAKENAELKAELEKLKLQLK